MERGLTLNLIIFNLYSCKSAQAFAFRVGTFGHYVKKTVENLTFLATASAMYRMCKNPDAALDHIVFLKRLG